MAKKDNEKTKLMNPTQLAQIFVNEFDRTVVEEISETVSKHSYADWVVGEVKKFLDKYTRAANPTEGPLFDMMEALYYALTHSEGPESEAFLNSFKFLSQFKNFVDRGISETNAALYAQAFMTQIDTVITDNKTKAALLLKMADRAFACGRDADQALINLLAKNDEAVTFEQWQNILSKLTKRYVFDFGMVWTIVEKMEMAAIKQIQAERSKVPYDIKALEKISADIQNILYNLSDKALGRHDAQAIQDRLRETTKKYALSTILSADLEALEKLPKSGYEQATELELKTGKLQQQIAELERQKRELEQQLQGKDKEIERINQELATTKKALSESQGENQTLRQENSNLALSKQNSENKLTKLIEGARQIKSGLGSRGVNEYKQMVEDIDAGIIR